MSRLFLVLTLIVSGTAWAEKLRHNLLETDSSIAYQTQRNCYGLYVEKSYIFCTPFSSIKKDEGEIKLDIFLKANEVAAETLYKLFSKEIDQTLLDKLFRDQNFESASGLARVTATYFNSELSYTPFHFVGAFKISNPSLPDFKLSGYEQNTLRFTQNFYFRNAFAQWDALITPSIFYYKRKFYEADFDVLTAASKTSTDLVSKTQDKSTDLDIAVALMSRKAFVPSFSFRVFNALNRFDCDACEERLVDSEYTVGTHASLSTSMFVNHPYGKSLFSVRAPYEGYNLGLNKDLISFAYIYNLSKLGTFFSFSPLMYSFGFIFNSSLYRVGIQYTNEKQPNDISIERRKQTYVFVSLVL